MSYWRLEEKAEDALYSVLKSLKTSKVSVGTAFTDWEMSEPYVLVSAPASQDEFPEAPLTGHRIVDAVVTIRSHAEPENAKTARDYHADLKAAALDLLYRSDLAAVLSAAVADFTCSEVEHGAIQRAIEEHSFKTTFTMRLHCRPS